ncbi:hypothetical protein BJ508DRAFT_360939 [Ascobolus immersus RN42]|uniref:Uncharacterized protein n=1 Tax=Ascobolus immersus RN42 TaxID=1160509 RepID=A0A3N4IET1_ASCIM|nr:hypothetical protein BJ508DRAFT_360939 [Ascobolus immersus RN42]
MQCIVENAQVDGKDRYITSTETVDIDIRTEEIIKATQDLFLLSRELKEAWALGQIGAEEEVQKIEEKMKEDLKIVGDAFGDFCTKDLASFWKSRVKS